MSSSSIIKIHTSDNAPQLIRENVVCIEPHPSLGLILQYRSVEKLASGNFSMESNKIRLQNADFYGLTPLEIEILNLIESYEPDNLIQRFYTGKKRISVNDFYEKTLTPELLEKEVRPYIERKILQALKELKGQTVYFWGKGTLNIWIPLVVETEPAHIVYKIQRKDENLCYSIEIKQEGKVIKVQNENNEVLLNTPAYVILNNSIYHFIDGQDGKRVRPFFNKKEIVIPQTAEEVYLNKFIIPIAEEYTVETQGVVLHKVNNTPKAILKIMTFTNDVNLGLRFDYGDKSYNANEASKGKASLTKEGGEWAITQMKRDLAWENQQAQLLEKEGFALKQGALFTLPENMSVAVFVQEQIPKLTEMGFEIDQENLKNPFFLAEPKLYYSVNLVNDWFDLEIKVRFGEVEIPFKKLRAAIIAGNRFYELPNGSIAILPDEWFEKLSPIIDYGEESSSKIKLGRFHYNLLEQFESIGINRSSEKLASVVKSYKKTGPIEVPATFNAKLRNYQKTGLQWLIALNDNRFGGLLADDMGLGKTIQTLAFFEWFLANKRPERKRAFELKFGEKTEEGVEKKPIPFIVVAPTSLLYNWKEEIERFTKLSAFIYSGNARNRYVWEYFHQYDVILTTYGTLRNDMDVLGRISFDIAVFDEAQQIKNPSSQSAKAALALPASQKILLTGTPIENSTADLWSLLNVSNPGILGPYTRFVKHFSNKIEKQGDVQKAKELKEITQPFILRRTKEQVAKELPPRHEQVFYCDMLPEQESLYEKTKSYFRNELMQTIQHNGLEKSRIYVLKGLLKLRQMANHPYLADNTFSHESGKFNQILESLDNVLKGGNKVLLFSQFVSHLKLFKQALQERNIPFTYIDGSINSQERAAQVKLFQDTKDYPVFLISLKAGGVGLNLTAADYVFLADPWWNPAVERQAMDRAHRIGRKNPVFVYKFITENTVEEKIIRLQERKKKLAGDIVSEDNNWLANIETEDLEELLS